MSGYVVFRYVLVCDRCETSLGEDGKYESATEARADAYNLGWRYPKRTTKHGHPSTRTYDVCAVCWVASPSPARDCEKAE